MYSHARTSVTRERASYHSSIQMHTYHARRGAEEREVSVRREERESERARAPQRRSLSEYRERRDVLWSHARVHTIRMMSLTMSRERLSEIRLWSQSQIY